METSVSNFLRKLRINRGETLRDMAKNLDVSPAFLSAVENGKKRMSDKLLESLSKKYDLTSEQTSELELAAQSSFDTLKVDLSGADCFNRELAVSFARSFKELGKEDSDAILKILNK